MPWLHNKDSVILCEAQMLVHDSAWLQHTPQSLWLDCRMIFTLGRVLPSWWNLSQPLIMHAYAAWALRSELERWPPDTWPCMAPCHEASISTLCQAQLEAKQWIPQQNRWARVWLIMILA